MRRGPRALEDTLAELDREQFLAFVAATPGCADALVGARGTIRELARRAAFELDRRGAIDRPLLQRLAEGVEVPGRVLDAAKGLLTVQEAAALWTWWTSRPKPSVLVVDDEPRFQQMVVQILEEMGFEAGAAPDGFVALAELERRPYDLVLSDVVMPGRSGPELARRAPTGLRFVLMSGDDAPRLERHDGALRVPFLPKPFTAWELLEAVRSVMEPGRAALADLSILDVPTAEPDAPLPSPPVPEVSWSCRLPEGATPDGLAASIVAKAASHRLLLGPPDPFVELVAGGWLVLAAWRPPRLEVRHLHPSPSTSRDRAWLELYRDNGLLRRLAERLVPRSPLPDVPVAPGEGVARGAAGAMRPEEFIRRFLLHVLPPDFRKIRHYGLLPPANVNTRHVTARRLLDEAGHRYDTRRFEPGELPGDPVASKPRCRACGSDRIRQDAILPGARGPPVGP